MQPPRTVVVTVEVTVLIGETDNLSILELFLLLI